MTAATAPPNRPGIVSGRRRKPKGAPASSGGQFDTEAKAESDAELDVDPTDRCPTDHGCAGEPATDRVLPPCPRCGQPGGIHACQSPSDDPATAFRYTSVNRKDRAERLEADLTAAVEEVVSS
ncbi:MAG TPA: hypothetical protein VIU87_01195, partial [Mycobacterium sp.]